MLFRGIYTGICIHTWHTTGQLCGGILVEKHLHEVKVNAMSLLADLFQSASTFSSLMNSYYLDILQLLHGVTVSERILLQLYCKIIL